jgi:hypothetical protein
MSFGFDTTPPCAGFMSGILFDLFNPCTLIISYTFMSYRFTYILILKHSFFNF